MRRFGLISDTHGHLHPDVFSLFEGVEAIWHAGDVVGEHLLDELEVIAPTLAVQGNCDMQSPRLPLLREIDAPFGRMILTHSHAVTDGVGPPSRLARHFSRQSPGLILFGHTHKQYCERHDGALVVNPGAAGKPRFQDQSSVAVLSWNESAGELLVEHKPLTWRKATR